MSATPMINMYTPNRKSAMARFDMSMDWAGLRLFVGIISFRYIRQKMTPPLPRTAANPRIHKLTRKNLFFMRSWQLENWPASGVHVSTSVTNLARQQKKNLSEYLKKKSIKLTSTLIGVWSYEVRSLPMTCLWCRQCYVVSFVTSYRKKAKLLRKCHSF